MEACPRFNRAAQAYLEWLPIRRAPGSMGCIDVGSITQVIEWGNLASFVAFDTRVSGRSKEPTLYSPFGAFGDVTGSATNAFGYDRPPVKQALEHVAAEINERYNDPKYTMISEENMGLLEEVMIDSAEAGKPWQIWVAATMFVRSFLSFLLDSFGSFFVAHNLCCSPLHHHRPRTTCWI